MKEYKDKNNLTYNKFLEDFFIVFEDIGGGSCMDNDDTDPHVSMARSVKFHFLHAMKQYQYYTNLEVAVW